MQRLNTQVWEAEGRRIVGRKIGLTARAVQAQLGVDQADYGVLFDDMRVPDGGVLDPARVLQPKAEAEVALVVKGDPADGLYKVSVRSKGAVDVGAVCTSLGGGGHRFAAGYTSTADLDATLDALRGALAAAPHLAA